MGRKPVPIEALRERGKSHLTKAQIKEREGAEKSLKPRADKIKPPAKLDKAAKREWNRVVAELKELDLLTNLDVRSLAIYCDAVSKHEAITKELETADFLVEHTNKNGSTNLVENPLFGMQVRYAQLIARYQAEFGLTPSARVKLTVPHKTEKPRNRFERFLG